MVRRPQGRPFHDVGHARGPRGPNRVHLEGPHVLGVRCQEEHPVGSPEQGGEGAGFSEVPFHPIDAGQMLGSLGVAGHSPDGRAFPGEQSDELAADVSGRARYEDHTNSRDLEAAGGN